MKEFFFNKNMIEGVILLFGIIITIIIIFLTKNNALKQNKKKLFQYILKMYFILIAPSILIGLFPIETIFFKFDTPKNAYDFAYPSGNIVFNKTKGNTSFLFGSDDRDLSPSIFVYYVRENGKWQIKRKSKDYNQNCLCMNKDDNISIYLAKSESDKLAGILISADSKYIDKIEVNDLYNTKFEFGEIDYSSFKISYYFGIVDKEIDDNYYVIVNDKKYYINTYGKYSNNFKCG